MKKEKYNVAVVGATGAVGEQMREVLEEREFPVGELRLLASERSAGQFLEFRGHQHRVDVLREDSFRDIDIGLFSAGGGVSAKFAPLAAAAGRRRGERQVRAACGSGGRSKALRAAFTARSMSSLSPSATWARISHCQL